MQDRNNPKLIQNMNSLMNLFNRTLNTVLKTYPVPLSLASYTLLWTVYDNPGLTQYKLSLVSGYTNQRCQQIIMNLHDSDLISREKKEYGNKFHIYITPRGEEVLEELYSVVHNQFLDGKDVEVHDLAARISIDLTRLKELL
ncbi:MAG: hypothetical protein PQJ50_11530 [Spirochaetales bacterium]|nr:hypothetical protein [Spirochaetales bacterium]